MYTIVLENFDLKQIAQSGQCFRMNEINDNCYSVIAFNKYLEITKDNSLKNTFHFSCDENEFQNIWYDYFDLATDYKKIGKLIDKNDKFLSEAFKYGKGIRILKQDIFETIITFIISQNNNIRRIKGIVENLCTYFGEKYTNFKAETYHGFPTREKLSSLKLEDLEPLRLGYRDKYILSIAKAIDSGEFSLTNLQNMDYTAAHKTLMNQYGIGKKVADCICLFGLHHVDAFPIDVHVKKILSKYYPDGFPFERYKGVAGIIQQYAFYYDLI